MDIEKLDKTPCDGVSDDLLQIYKNSFDGVDDPSWRSIATFFAEYKRRYLHGEKHSRSLNCVILTSRNLAAANAPEDAECTAYELLPILDVAINYGSNQIVQSSLQFFANLAQSRTRALVLLTKIKDLESLGWGEAQKCGTNRALTSLDCRWQEPFLVLLLAAVKQEPQSLDVLQDSRVAPLILHILTTASDADAHNEWIDDLVLNLIQARSFEGVFQAELRGLARVDLLRRVDAVLPRVQNENVKEQIWQVLGDFVQESVRQARDCISENRRSVDIWRRLNVSLDVCTGMLDSQKLALKIWVEDREFVQRIIELLAVCQKHLPVASKLSKVRSKLDPMDFPQVKGKLIWLIGVFASLGPDAQTLIAQTHCCLEIVLSNCIVDANNPFIQQVSIVCLRYLLQNNEANQKIVRAMEAQQTVTDEALLKAGLEAQFVGGKLELKKSCG